jgi:hypothetical protein
MSGSKKISQLNSLTALSDTDYIEVVDASESNQDIKNKQVLLSDLRAYLGAATAESDIFEDWDSATEYDPLDGVQYVFYGGAVYEFISESNSTNERPDLNPFVWEQKTALDFSHQQNTDQYLDFGGANEVAASNVVNKVSAQTIAGVKTFTSDPIIPDEAYGSGFNGSLEPVTKNAVYDKIETIFPVNAKSNTISSLVGDGTTDDSAALTALIAGLSAGDTIFFPPGSYEITGVTISKKLTLLGFGAKIITTTDATMLTIAADDVVISGIEFRGDAVTSKTSQIGISVDNFERWIIKDCKFYEFAGAGFYGTNTHNSGYLNQRINNCLFSNCNDNAGDPAGKGLWLSERCEYVVVSNCVFDSCDIGTYNTGGNNTYIGCHFTQNRIGGYVESGTNNGHGKFVGCSFNHQTAYAIWIEDTALGFSIEGCHMYAGILRFTNTSGVKITGGIMSVEGIWFENSIVSINNVVMANSYSNPITDNYNATVGYGLWYNNINLDATYSAAYNTVSPQLSYATASRAMVLDANKIPQASAVTAAELAYLSGVTSLIQTQIDNAKWTYARVSGSNVTETGQTLVDITGLSIALLANTTYEFEAVLSVGTSADTTGIRYAVQYSAAGASIEAGINGSSTSTACKAERISAFNTQTGVYMASTNQSGQIVIKGIVIVGANAGNLTIQHLKVTSGTSTVRIDSFIKTKIIA